MDKLNPYLLDPNFRQNKPAVPAKPLPTGDPIKDLNNSINYLASVLQPAPSSSALQPYSTLVVDLTVANSNPGKRITMQNPVKFLQFWSDGGLDGISVNIGEQSAPSNDLNRMSVIPLNQEYHDLWVTNDVRQGRSILVIYFVKQDTPLQLALAGQDISLSELAVRNGSISSFDRRGDIIWQDDFESGLNKWLPYSAAGWSRGDSVVLSSDLPRNGSTSVKVTTGNLVLDEAGIIHRLPNILVSPSGIEISFTNPGNIRQFDFNVERFDGAFSRGFYLRYLPLTTTLQVFDNTGAYVTVSNAVSIYESDVTFNTLKLLFDFTNSKYVRAILNNNKIDLSNYRMNQGASVLQARLNITILGYAHVAANQIFYLDDFILTQNEL
jgi:hypothetical protein